MKIAQSGTREGITSLVKEFYKYNTVCELDFSDDGSTATIRNGKGLINGVQVRRENGKREKWIFETI